MITLAEVIEACAKVCEEAYPYSVFHTDQRASKNCAAAIRTLKAQYEGCIVAEGEASAHRWLVRHNDVDGWVVGHNEPPPYAIEQQPLYRAKEPTK